MYSLPKESENFLSEVTNELADVPAQIRNFFYLMLDLSWPMYPTPQIEKKSSKNEMLLFGLCSTSHDWPSNLSGQLPEMEKTSHQIIKK